MNSIKIFNNFKTNYASLGDLTTQILNYYLTYLQNQMVRKRKFIPNIKTYFSNNLDEINYKILTPGYKITFNESELNFLKEPIICSRNIQRNKLEGYTQRETFTCVFRNLKFFGHSGGICYNDLPILESVSTITRLKLYTRTIDSFILRHRKMKGVYSSIMHVYEDNYYHWLIERVPRLYGICQIEEPEINLIVPNYIPKWQLERLKIFLDERFKLVPIGYNEIWQLEKFYFSSFYNRECSAYMPQLYSEFIRNKIFEYYRIKKKKERRRIYISRNKMAARKLKNEEQFFDLLKKYGFERVHPQDLSFKDQVELFNSAEIIVGMTGAALSNIIFSENLKILIIYPRKLIITHFMLLCKALGFTHKYLIGFEEDKYSNIRVDLLSAEKIIKELIEL